MPDLSPDELTHPDPVASAKEAGLRYVHDTRPGITRVHSGDTFAYFHPDGTPGDDDKTLGRIQKLGIPPAYQSVWICPLANGHLQATGLDARGRKQYRYHPQWRAVRDDAKYGRMIAFGEALPALRARVSADLARRGMPREKVLAATLRLLEQTHIRVGNEAYARENNSFGLTTLHNDHVDVSGSTAHFHFRGKSGKDHAIDLHDKRLARIIRQCQELPGDELFEYLDEDGQPRTVDSADVNAYLQEISGHDLTAKDFRTWAGTVLAARALTNCEDCLSETQAKRAIAQAIKRVAAQLGNTPAVCRKCYVHPAVLDSYSSGTLRACLSRRAADADPLPASQASPDEERAILDLLRAALPTP